MVLRLLVVAARPRAIVTSQPETASVTILVWLENNPLSTSVRESALLYPTILMLHSVGMAILVGVNSMVALRLLGCAPRLPLAPIDKLFPVMWAGFWLNLVTGLVLLVSAATKHLLDPVMYFKLGLITTAVLIIRATRTRVFRGRASDDTTPVGVGAKVLAAASLTAWALAVTSGRLTAYEFFRFWNWK
jgi:hypothetical protein